MKTTSHQATKSFTPQCNGLLQRKCACGGNAGLDGECAECREERLSRQSHSSAPESAPPIVNDVLRSPGQPLTLETRTFMEPRFGHDFSRVRIHTDAWAAESAKTMGAQAYTVGPNIVFGAGEYDSSTRSGNQLLAHELTHVIQQEGGQFGSPQTRLEVSQPGDATEREADAIGEKIAKGEAVRVQRQAGAVVQMQGRGRTGETNVTVEAPSGANVCQLNQHNEIEPAVFRARRWLNQAYNLLNAYIGDPAAAANRPVREALNRHFHTVDSATAIQIRNRIDQIRANIPLGSELETVQRFGRLGKVLGGIVGGGILGAAIGGIFGGVGALIGAGIGALAGGLLGGLTGPGVTETVETAAGRRRPITVQAVECHDNSDPECGNFSAYIPGNDKTKLIFCPRFFGKGKTWQAEALIHEIVHTLVGGDSIEDRGYASDRVLPELSREEALTNAESYGLFIQQLGTGRVPVTTAPRDILKNCPPDWKPLIRTAVARAERWNRDALTATTDRRTDWLSGWQDLQKQYLGATTTAALDGAKDIYKKVQVRLNSPLDIECEPAGGDNCKRFPRWYWSTDLHLCPGWKNLSDEDDRITSMLEGLIGYLGNVHDQERRRNLANLAHKLNDRYWSL